jgi:hypothetical protein
MRTGAVPLPTLAQNVTSYVPPATIGVTCVETGPVASPPDWNALCKPERALVVEAVKVPFQLLHPLVPASKSPFATRFGSGSPDEVSMDVEAPAELIGSEVGSVRSEVCESTISLVGAVVITSVVSVPGSELSVGIDVSPLVGMSDEVPGLTVNVSSPVSDVVVVSSVVLPPPPVELSSIVAVDSVPPPSGAGKSGTESSSEHPTPDAKAKPTTKPKRAFPKSELLILNFIATSSRPITAVRLWA